MLCLRVARPLRTGWNVKRWLSSESTMRASRSARCCPRQLRGPLVNALKLYMSGSSVLNRSGSYFSGSGLGAAQHHQGSAGGGVKRLAGAPQLRVQVRRLDVDEDLGACWHLDRHVRLWGDDVVLQAFPRHHRHERVHAQRLFQRTHRVLETVQLIARREWHSLRWQPVRLLRGGWGGAAQRA